MVEAKSQTRFSFRFPIKFAVVSHGYDFKGHPVTWGGRPIYKSYADRMRELQSGVKRDVW